MTSPYLSSFLALGLTVALTPAVIAQSPDENPSNQEQVQVNGTLAFGLNSAKNLARQTIEKEYGGILKYRAEPSMHGTPEESPYVENPNGGYTFTFKGLVPDENYDPDNPNYIYESEVTVNNKDSIVINYNGAIRTTSAVNNTNTEVVQSTSTTVGDSSNNASISLGLNQAKNLARQAAEVKNGGLGEYRAEGSMHSTASESPYVANTDGSYTFTFKGRHPDSLDFIYESVVTVTSDGTATVDSNLKDSVPYSAER
ncbi:hypothetical protein Lepto7376_3588 [[Leptolyngbya] sp. PCC 7376]|uniref:hypothetical protein n=1 Tax=[Leptolyngbya] sp. PCC 7376 TaxID=111781 RepID=UPI00029F1D8B|nr:hypothetical protein [[Leptolyngbya] sp. PCC 7376]AFY39777.1 hypothetical protein Lepto7376_3588 [[Leptolyngbya] sp. PCC 7376]